MLVLLETIPQIESLEVGRDEFGDERSWSLLLSMTFPSVTALQDYQTHPDHIAAMEFNAPWVTEIGSIDYHSSQNESSRAWRMGKR